MAKSWNDHHNPYGEKCRAEVRALHKRYRYQVKRMLKAAL